MYWFYTIPIYSVKINPMMCPCILTHINATPSNYILSVAPSNIHNAVSILSWDSRLDETYNAVSILSWDSTRLTMLCQYYPECRRVSTLAPSNIHNAVSILSWVSSSVDTRSVEHSQCCVNTILRLETRRDSQCCVNTILDETHNAVSILSWVSSSVDTRSWQ